MLHAQPAGDPCSPGIPAAAEQAHCTPGEEQATICLQRLTRYVSRRGRAANAATSSGMRPQAAAAAWPTQLVKPMSQQEAWHSAKRAQRCDVIHTERGIAAAAARTLPLISPPLQHCRSTLLSTNSPLGCPAAQHRSLRHAGVLRAGTLCVYGSEHGMHSHRQPQLQRVVTSV